MTTKPESKVVIDLLLSDSDSDEEEKKEQEQDTRGADDSIVHRDASAIIENSTGNQRSRSESDDDATAALLAKSAVAVSNLPPGVANATATKKRTNTTRAKTTSDSKPRSVSVSDLNWNRSRKGGNSSSNKKKTSQVKTTTSQGLQAGLVLEEDIFAAFPSNGANEYKHKHKHDNATTAAGSYSGSEPIISLFEDDDFGPVASSIQGTHRASIADVEAEAAGIDDGSSSGVGNNGIVAPKKKAPARRNADTDDQWRPKCRCNLRSILSFQENGVKGNGKGNGKGEGEIRPYFRCGKTARGRKCRFFEWAFRAELTPWYRFGSHNHHVLVRPSETTSSLSSALSSALSSLHDAHPNHASSVFSARDLVQGRVGDCWFLSALAVVAERPDLVERLFRGKTGQATFDDERRGIVRVNLFLDGIWTPVVLDNFLPCNVGGGKQRREEEADLQRAIEASLLPETAATNAEHKNTKNKIKIIRNPYAKPKKAHDDPNSSYTQQLPAVVAAARNDPLGLSANNFRVMKVTSTFLQKQHGKHKSGTIHSKGCSNSSSNSNSNSFHPRLVPEGRLAQTHDLAYSKASRNQLWVPFLEKAYAKIHGSYKAINGGHIAEAFLDLTGAPTLQIGWHRGSEASVGCSTIYQDPRRLWADLKKWRSQRLPMGCGTDSSAQGLVGMHAYSILDVREISNVGVDFFRDRLLGGTLGNVSGFTEYDGKVRLLQVRNPHGQGEWKGEFSDKCELWEKLMMNSGITLPRTMANDGTFWIGYDDFLLGFSNIDVVLAHEGNHAKSFVSNFPPKKSNHRCQRAFEVSLIDPQPGLETKERVEVFVMGIQKSRRGARQGRADRKKSYKVSDFGILVGEYPLWEEGNGRNKNERTGRRSSSKTGGCSTPTSIPFSAVHGQMFGFERNGHYKLVLDRKRCKRLVVMPVSFGHPAATDEFLSFVVRFNADAPLMIRELESVPRMDRVLGEFLIQPKPLGHFANTRQGKKTVLWANRNYKVVRIDCRGNRGGTVFVYLCAAGAGGSGGGSGGPATREEAITLGIEATCRGMSCRVGGGLLDHETIAKGKKFEASWRKFSTNFSIGGPKSSTGEGTPHESRLVMVLYKSGQDTEMGSITCQSIPMGHRLGGRNDSERERPTKPIASNTTTTTLDKYWKTKPATKPATTTTGTTITTPKNSCVDDDYERLGVFHPISMDADAFQRCGSNYEIAVASNGGHEPDGDANSNLNSNSNSNSNLDLDLDLEQAIALSLQQQGPRSEESIVTGHDAAADADGKLSVVEEAELREAIRRSCREGTRPSRPTSAGPSVAATAAAAAGTTTTSSVVVVDLAYEAQPEDNYNDNFAVTNDGSFDPMNDVDRNQNETNDNDNGCNADGLDQTIDLTTTTTTEAPISTVASSKKADADKAHEQKQKQTRKQEQTRKRKRKRKRIKTDAAPVVLDLTATDADALFSASKNPTRDSIVTARKESANKRDKNGEEGDNDNNNNVFVLVDSSSSSSSSSVDEEEEGRSGRNCVDFNNNSNGRNCVDFNNNNNSKNARDSSRAQKQNGRNDEAAGPKRERNDDEHQSTRTGTNSSSNGESPSREKKRKLAAEAALKRLQRWS